MFIEVSFFILIFLRKLSTQSLTFSRYCFSNLYWIFSFLFSFFYWSHSPKVTLLNMINSTKKKTLWMISSYKQNKKWKWLKIIFCRKQHAEQIWIAHEKCARLENETARYKLELKTYLMRAYLCFTQSSLIFNSLQQCIIFSSPSGTYICLRTWEAGKNLLKQGTF